MTKADLDEQDPAAVLGSWWDEAVRPRWRIVRLLPSGGVPLVVGLALLNLVLGVMPVAFILATSVLIGLVPAVVEAGIGSEAWNQLVVVFGWMAGAFLARQLLTPVVTALTQRLKRRVDGAVRDQVVAVAASTIGIGLLEDQAVLDELDEATRFLDEDWATPGAAAGGMLALIARYTQLIGYVAIVAVVVGWWAGIAVFAVTMLFRYGQRGGLRRYSVVWRSGSRVHRAQQYFLELGSGPGSAKELRVFGLAPWIADRFDDAYSEMFRRVARERRRILFIPYLVYTAIGIVVTVAVMVAIAVLAARGEIGLTALALGTQSIAFAVLLGEYFPEADVLTQYGMQAVDALDRLRERRDRMADAEVGAGGGAPVPRNPRDAVTVRFEKVVFRYPGSSQTVLDGVTFELSAGRSTALVGVNGAGKTTIVKLLTRLYEPSEGRITVNGVDIAELDVTDWRRTVSVIFQDFVRYELSAADNIALGAAWAPRERSEVRAAAERADVASTIQALPEGYDTVLSRGYEGGTDLSGGQWQRIAIARSLFALGAGAGMLVLDEPTSALDVRAEVAFFDRFVEITRGATALLISHRFSSVRRADRIVVIERGRVVEEGSHQELMATDGHYATLFRLQAERFANGLDAEGNRIEPDVFEPDVFEPDGFEEGAR